MKKSVIKIVIIAVLFSFSIFVISACEVTFSTANNDFSSSGSYLGYDSSDLLSSYSYENKSSSYSKLDSLSNSKSTSLFEYKTTSSKYASYAPYSSSTSSTQYYPVSSTSSIRPYYPVSSTSSSTQYYPVSSTSSSTQYYPVSSTLSSFSYSSSHSSDTSSTTSSSQAVVSPEITEGKFVRFEDYYNFFASILTSRDGSGAFELDVFSQDTTIGIYTILTGNRFRNYTTVGSIETEMKQFMQAVQLGKDIEAGYYNKSMQFTVSSAGTLDVWCARSSSSAIAPVIKLVTPTETIQIINLDASGTKSKVTFVIPYAGQYAICGSGESGVNVGGVRFNPVS